VISSTTFFRVHPMQAIPGLDATSAASAARGYRTGVVMSARISVALSGRL
jgi:hypothetical protein